MAQNPPGDGGGAWHPYDTLTSGSAVRFAVGSSLQLIVTFYLGLGCECSDGGLSISEHIREEILKLIEENGGPGRFTFVAGNRARWLLLTESLRSVLTEG